MLLKEGPCEGGKKNIKPQNFKGVKIEFLSKYINFILTLIIQFFFL